MLFEYLSNQFHPTQKPLSALQPLIESFTKLGDIVLDSFAGSGSTCIAAMLSKCHRLGIELNSKYHVAAIKCMGLMAR
jgi:adenine-specific DNA-methyltransferase